MYMTAGFVAYNLLGIVFQVRVPWDSDSDFDLSALVQFREYAEAIDPGCRISVYVYEWNETGSIVCGWGLRAWHHRVAWDMQPTPPFVKPVPRSA